MVELNLAQFKLYDVSKTCIKDMIRYIHLNKNTLRYLKETRK